MASRSRLTFRRRMLHALEGAMYWSGAGFLYTRAAPRSGAVILMYHSVARTDTARFIDRRFRVEPETFAELVEWLDEKRDTRFEIKTSEEALELMRQVAKNHELPLNIWAYRTLLKEAFLENSK